MHPSALNSSHFLPLFLMVVGWFLVELWLVAHLESNKLNKGGLLEVSLAIKIVIISHF